MIPLVDGVAKVSEPVRCATGVFGTRCTRTERPNTLETQVDATRPSSDPVVVPA
jgi:hypothetical protein